MEIHFGLLSPTITQQLKQQNLSVENSENYDKCVECMNTLWCEYFLTDKEREKVFKRIFKQIEREVKLIDGKFYDLKLYEIENNI